MATHFQRARHESWEVHLRRHEYPLCPIGLSKLCHWQNHYATTAGPNPSRQEAFNAVLVVATLMGAETKFIVDRIRSVPSFDVVNLYTSNVALIKVGDRQVEFFRWLNRFFLNDCQCGIMEYIMPYIRRLNNALTKQQHAAFEVRRCLSLPAQSLKQLEKCLGGYIRFPPYLSCSLRKGGAAAFKGKNCHLHIRVPRNNPNCRAIHPWETDHADEEEVLFVPFSQFKVDRVEHTDAGKGRIFYLTAVDNMELHPLADPDGSTWSDSRPW